MTFSPPSLPCVIPDLSNDDYHSAEGVSKSALWTLHSKSPAHLRWGEKPQTAAMAKGTLMHTAVLEPEKFDGQYVCAPKDAPARPTERQLNAKKPSDDTLAAIAFWQAFDGKNKDRIAVEPEEFAAASIIRDKLRSDYQLAGIFARKPLFESSVFWQDELTKETCRCRPDLALRGVIMGDLKTINDASGDGPRKAIENFGYHMQAAYYQDGWHAATGERLPFLFIFTETVKPYAYRCIELDWEYLDIGRQMYRKALNTYSECRKQNIWPAYPTAIQTLEPSPWLRKNWDRTQLTAE